MTITGTILDSFGSPVYCAVLFVPLNAPQELVGGELTACAARQVMTSTLGAFSITLTVGGYDVIYKTSPEETRFAIAVPDSDSTADISTLVTTTGVTPTTPVSYGIGSPEGVVTATKGRIYWDMTNLAAPNQWVKTTTSGNTGWVSVIGA